jgi:hypothetical protein
MLLLLPGAVAPHEHDTAPYNRLYVRDRSYIATNCQAPHKTATGYNAYAGLGPGRRSFSKYSRTACSVVNQFRPTFTPSISPRCSNRRIQATERPVRSWASVTEMSWDVKSSRDCDPSFSPDTAPFFSCVAVFPSECATDLTNHARRKVACQIYRCPLCLGCGFFLCNHGEGLRTPIR